MKNVTKIGNVNPENSYCLACAVCGIKENLHLTAHRNNKGEIVGFVSGCNKCFNGNQDLIIEIKDSQN